MGDDVPQAFRMETGQIGGTDVVRIYGELDLVHADEVRLALEAAPGNVVVDLSELEFIDSTGLSSVLVARRHVEGRGKSLEIRGARGAVRKLFEAAGLADVLDD